jgi:hypothetical protein
MQQTNDLARMAQWDESVRWTTDAQVQYASRFANERSVFGRSTRRKGVNEHANANRAANRLLPAPAGIVLSPAIECAGSLVEAGELVKDA